MRSLDLATAEALAAHRGTLGLHGVRRIPPAAAAALGQHAGIVDLSGLDGLSPEVGEQLAIAGTVRFKTGLLRSLSPAMAAGLARWGDDELELGGITRLSPAAAEALVTHRGELVLAGIKELTGADAQAVARALARKPGRVKLSWLEIATPRTLEILAATGRIETPDIDELTLVPDYGSGVLDDVVVPERRQEPPGGLSGSRRP